MNPTTNSTGKPPGSRSLEDVLSDHQRVTRGMTPRTPDTCSCGELVRLKPGERHTEEARHKAFAFHQAQVIKEAGNAV